MDQEGEAGHQRLMRGVNWALDSKDVSKELHDKEIDEATSLLLPVYLPSMYGSHDEDVRDATLTHFWIGREFIHGFGSAMEAVETPEDEKIEEAKIFGI
jgi:hypothetical protein